MTDLTTLDDHHIAPANDRLYFSLLKEQGEILANAMMVPAAYRGKSAEIIAAGMAGRAFGWDVMMSMRNFHVIQGTASLRPEAMLGLVYRAGHSVVITEEDGVAFAVGTRKDNGDTHSERFDLADAKAAGLSNKQNWKQFQKNMLKWRAVTNLCRFLFPDIVLGAGYVPEELGADVGPEGVPLVPSAKAKTLLVEAFGKEQAIELWGDRGSSGISDEDLQNLLAIDAEIIDEPEMPTLVPESD